MRAALRDRGFAPRQPTLTLTGSVKTLLTLHAGPPADIDSAPDAAWTGMFLGPGLDAEDGASRSLTLARGLETQFVSLREGGQTLACGAAGLAMGWLSVHGMRTALACRGQRLAQRVLLAMAGEAHRPGIDRVFLQVDASNAPASVWPGRMRIGSRSNPTDPCVQKTLKRPQTPFHRSGAGRFFALFPSRCAAVPGPQRGAWAP
jgi:hypothetical protein